jgi:zinc transporter
MRSFLFDKDKASELPFADGDTPGGAALHWLHFDGRKAESRAWLSAEQTIEEVARNALVAAETRPRCESFTHGVLINLRGLGETPDDDPDPLVSIRLWVEARRVISFTYRSPLFLEPVIGAFMAGGIKDPGDLIAAFADTITQQLNPHIADIGDELDTCELALDQPGALASRHRVSSARSRAIAYRRFVIPQRTALETLAAVPHDWLDKQDRLHLREAADRAARMAEELESVRERAALMHDQLTDLRAEQIDSRALLVSIIALVFLPLTFLTGLLGMNVDGIPFAHAPWAFWGVVAFCVVMGLLVGVYFIRAHWISRS